ncbi:hypothetical protein LTR59_018370, partial [Friedmanniomyces endolithicus]
PSSASCGNSVMMASCRLIVTPSTTSLTRTDMQPTALAPQLTLSAPEPTSTAVLRSPATWLMRSTRALSAVTTLSSLSSVCTLDKSSKESSMVTAALTAILTGMTCLPPMRGTFHTRLLSRVLSCSRTT